MGIIDTLKREGTLRLHHGYCSGTIRDWSGLGNHGTFSGSEFSFGPNGLRFFGTSFVQIADTPTLQLTSQISVIAYANTFIRHPSGGMFYVKRSGVNGIQFFCASGVAIGTSDGAASSTIVHSITNKRCLAFSLTAGTKPLFYSDGAYLGLGTNNQNLNLTNVTSRVGYFTASIDQTVGDILVVSRVLTDTEHSAIFAELANLRWPLCPYVVRAVDSSVVPNTPNLVWAPDLQQPTNSNTLVDRSPSGWNATLTGSQTPVFGIDGIGKGITLNPSANYWNATVSFPNVNNFTLSVLLTWKSVTGLNMLLCSNQWYLTTLGAAFRFSSPADAQLYDSVGYTGAIGRTCLVTLVYNSDNSVDYYINGLFLNHVNNPLPAAAAAVSFWLGRYSTLYSSHKVYRAEVYNRALTAAEVKVLYERSEMRDIVDTYNWGIPVSTANRGGIAGSYLENTALQFGTTTPRYVVDVSTINGETVKVVRCVTAGALYEATDSHFTPQQAAFGTWEWSINKGADANVPFYFPIASGKSATTLDGYSVSVNGNESITLWEVSTGGVFSTKFTTAAGYAAINTWYTLRLARTFAGVFTLWILGGVYTNWTQVGTATDTSFVLSNYTVLDLDASDMVSLVSLRGNYPLSWKPFI